jgi:hypothetical protein
MLPPRLPLLLPLLKQLKLRWKHHGPLNLPPQVIPAPRLVK